MNNTTTPIDNGGPAFPFIASPESHWVYTGMTLRDWFAGQALNGNCVKRQYANWNDLASDCYQIADAMLVARNTKP
jgi:hypothetical protein